MRIRLTVVLSVVYAAFVVLMPRALETRGTLRLTNAATTTAYAYDGDAVAPQDDPVLGGSHEEGPGLSRPGVPGGSVAWKGAKR